VAPRADEAVGAADGAAIELIEQAKFTAVAKTIAELRRLKDVVTPAVLLQKALDLTGYDAVLLSEFLGQRKLANPNKLLEQARAIDQAQPAQGRN